MITEYIFKELFDKIDYAIGVRGASGESLLWNQCAKQTLLIPKQIADMNDWQNYCQIYKMDKKLYETKEAPLMRALKGEIINKERMEIVTPAIPEGKFLEVSAFPIKDTENNIIAAAATFTDITKMVKLERFIEGIEERFQHIKNILQAELL